MGARPSKSRHPNPASSSLTSTSLQRSKGIASTASSSLTWTDLQPDLVDLFLRRLTSHADRVRFAAVCRHWRYVAREYSPPRLPPPLPWISFRVGPFETLTIKDGDVGERHFIGFKKEAVSHGSFGNWQLFLERAWSGRRRIFPHCHRYLRNPLSGATMQLPSHCDKPVRLDVGASHDKPSIWRSTSKFNIRKVIVCSDDLIAAIVLYPHHRMGNLQVVVCCRPDMSSWSRGYYDRSHWYTDMAFYVGKLYTVTREGHLFVHEVTGSGRRSTKAKPRVNRVQQVNLTSPPSLGWFFTSLFANMSCYLVISSTGKLWMVRWVLPYGNNQEVVVKVLEADLETSWWLEVKRLGDQVLFLSQNCSKAVSTSDPGGYPKRNRIYFLDNILIRSCFPEDRNNRACIYYMRSKKFDQITVGQSIGCASWFFP